MYPKETAVSQTSVGPQMFLFSVCSLYSSVQFYEQITASAQKPKDEFLVFFLYISYPFWMTKLCLPVF